MTRLYCADCSPLESDGLFDGYLAGLSQYRQEKNEKLRFRRDRNLSLGAGLLIDMGLREYGMREKEMEYALAENGKPFFKNAPEIHFNVSHSGTRVLAVFSDAPAGCDIEEIRDADLKIAKRFFCSGEYEAICASPTDQNREFYRMWTLKESFIKCTGFGLSLALNEFCIHRGDEITVSCARTDGDYRFRTFDEIDGYACSVCTRGELPLFPETVEF